MAFNDGIASRNKGRSSFCSGDSMPCSRQYNVSLYENFRQQWIGMVFVQERLDCSNMIAMIDFVPYFSYVAPVFWRRCRQTDSGVGCLVTSLSSVKTIYYKSYLFVCRRFSYKQTGSIPTVYLAVSPFTPFAPELRMHLTFLPIRFGPIQYGEYQHEDESNSR